MRSGIGRAVNVLRRLKGGTIVAQITILVVLAVLGSNVLALVVILTFLNSSPEPPNPRSWENLVGHVGRMIIDAPSQDERDTIILAARRAGIPVQEVAIADLLPGNSDVSSILPIASSRLAEVWGLPVLKDKRMAAQNGPGVALAAGPDRALVFGLDAASLERPSAILPLLPTLSALTVTLVLLAAYAVRAVASPISLFASAARAFAKFPASDQALPESGPSEIREASRAFNQMRSEIRRLVSGRTQMLLAMSHDVRTPLTRLRLRLERAPDSVSKEEMLGDISTIDRMVEEALTYLRDAHLSEQSVRTDLPSLVMSVCSRFSDMGWDVHYEGPDRLSYECKPLALSRALSNLVDNGIKHGTRVSVRLTRQADDGILIRVTDNGPGIPAEQRERVFEPFVKGSPAREVQGNSGFGLGLAIAKQVVSEHRGTIWLEAAQPQGLVAAIGLPPAANGA